MPEQKLLYSDDNYAQLDAYLASLGVKRLLLVCGKSISRLRVGEYFDELPARLGVEVVRFSDFKPNPLYESVVEGVKKLHETDCGCIVAVGGGSAMDVAKCIKLYSNMDPAENYLKQKIVPNELPLVAVPTTSGTGSEATRFAVVYYGGEKQSVADMSAIPAAVLIDPSTLHTLPDYQRASTMLDALCHAIESFWSVNSTEESRALSRAAIRAVMESMDAYLENTDEGNAAMLAAANTAGRAINITQTTAGHAMCYKLTSLYGIAHGHAAALCLSELWPFMIENAALCTDSRGEKYLAGVFGDIADAMGCAAPEAAVSAFRGVLKRLGMSVPEPQPEDFEVLRTSVNPVRLKNNPVALDPSAIDRLYHLILQKRS